MIVNTLNGLDRVPRVLLKTARIQRLGRVSTALKSSLPFAAPYVFTGIKLAVAYSFIGVIGAELIMSRTGLGYEIGYAYNNFDNAVMYPLIVLVLTVAAIGECRLLRLGEETAGEAAKMSKRRRAVNAALLIGGLVVVWQVVLFLGSPGANALASPAETLRFTYGLLASPCFYPHLSGTARAFAIALIFAVEPRHLDRSALGAQPLCRRSRRADPGRRLLHPEDHALSDRAAGVRHRHAGQDRLRRDAWHRADRHFHHGRAAQSQPGLLEDGARASDVALADRIQVLFPASVPEVFTGFRIGFSLTLIGTLLGEMFASQRGLGYLLMQAIGLHNIRMITAVTFILVCVAVTASAALWAVDRRLHRRIPAEG